MKQNLLFNRASAFGMRFIMVLTMLLVVGVGQAWGAEGDTHNFSQSLSQLLNNNASVASIEIAEQSYAIKTVKVTSDYNKSAGGVTMEVLVAGTSWGKETHNSDETKTFTFSGTSTKGKVTIKFTNNCESGTGKGTFKVTNVQLVEGAAAKPYTVTFHTTATKEEDIKEASAGAGVTPPTMEEECGEWEFQGWSESSSNSENSTTPLSVVTLTSGKYYPTKDIDLYPVYTKTEDGGGSVEETLAQTLQYDTWSYSGSTTNKTSYRLFHSNSYVESAEFDLSTLSKVVVYGGTFGGDSYNKLTIAGVVGGTTTTWKSVTVSGNSQTGVNTYTGGTSLSGTGKLRVTSNSGSSSSSGVRISKIMIYTLQATSTTYYYSYPQCITETTVSLNPNEGTGSMADVTTQNGTLTLPKCTFTREGYTFAGWATSASGEVAFADEEVVSNWDADITELFAKWTAKTITITWNLNYTGATSTTSSYTYDGAKITPPTPTRTGYSFNGWFTATTGGTKITEVGTTNKPTENVTYYAQWTAKTITITWDLNYTGATSTTSSYTYDGATIALPTPTRTGYSFNGWFTAATGGTKITEVGTTNKPTENVTYYAQWTEKALTNYRTFCDVVCDAYSFHTGTGEKETWSKEAIKCFTEAEGGYEHEWQIKDYIIPVDDKFFVGNYGYFYNDNLGSDDTNGKSRSVVSDWGNMYLAPAMDENDAEGTPRLGHAKGAKGTLRIFDDSNWDNLYVGFIPDGYKLMFGDEEYTLAKTTGTEYRSDVVQYNSTNADKNVSVGVVDADGKYVATNHTQEEMRHIFLKDNCGWSNDGAKLAIYYWGGLEGWCGFLKTVPGDATLFEGWIPSNATHLKFVRYNSSQSNPGSWDYTNDIWNETGDLTIPSDNNLFTMTEFSNGTWSAYERYGQFAMHDNSKSKNWYVHFVPHYELTYNKNATDATGEMAKQTVAVDAADKKVVVANCRFTRPGYEFESWRKGETTTYFVAGVNHELVADVTFYAKWKAKKITITWDANGGSVDPTKSTYTYNGATITPPTPTRANYIFNGWFTEATGGTKITEVGTNNKPTENVTYYAQWTEKATPTFAWSADSYTAALEADNTFPTLDNPAGLSVTYTSSDENVAKIDANDNIVLGSEGRTTITAIGAESASHKSATDTYELIVKPANCKWVETTTIEDGDEVVITSQIGGVVYALPNTYGTSTPGVMIVNNIKNNEIPSVSNDIKWTIEKQGEQYIFHPNGDLNSWLYCTNSNDGVRVGTNANKTFAIGQNLESITHVATNRSIRIGTTAPGQYVWRCYTTTSDQTLKLYKRECLDVTKVWVEGNLTNVTCEPQLPQQLAKDGSITLTFTAVDGYTLPDNVTVTNATKTWNKSTGTLTISNPTNNVLITIEAVKLHTITWMVGSSSILSEDVANGTGVTQTPSDPQNNAIGDCADTFLGWSEKSAGSTPQVEAYYDDLCTAAQMKSKHTSVTGDKTFYAVFATATTTPGTSTTTNTTYSHTITATTWEANGSQTLNGVSWTLSNNGNYYGYEGTKGQQVGSGSKPATSMTLTTSGFASASKITSVTINTSGASSTNAKVSVKVGGTSYSCNANTTPAISTTATDYKFTGNSTGEIVISWSQISSKAIYFKSITVEYSNTTTTPDVTEYSDYVTNCCALAPATNLTVSGTTSNTATLTWTAPSPATGITKLQVRNADNDAIVVDDIAVGTTTATITGLTECTKYNYYVASVGDCEVFSNIVTAQPFSNAKTVNYDYNGGSGSPASFTTSCEKQEIVLPTATRAGYDFNGWYTAATGGTKVGDAGGTYNPTTSPITLYAQWTIKQYTITWNPNGGNWGGSTSNIVETYEHGATLVQPAVPQRDGYRFTGWSPTVSESVTSDKTYTAQWKQNYTITFHDGNDVTPWTQTKDAESINLTEYVGTLACDDYQFAGWSTDATQYNDEPANITTWVTGNYTPTANIDLYAVYTKGAVTNDFTLNCAGGVYEIWEKGHNQHMAGRQNGGGDKFYTTEWYNGDCTSCEGTDGAPFTITKVADLTYTLQNADGQYITGNSYDEDDLNIEDTWENADEYKWTISAGDNGTWRFTNKASNEYALVFYDKYFQLRKATNVTLGSDYYDLELTPAAANVYQSNPNCGPYYIRFETHGGEFIQGEYPYGEEKTGLTETTYAKFPAAELEGYTFAGWRDGNPQEDVNYEPYLKKQGEDLVVSSNKTYHAVYYYYDEEEDIDWSEEFTTGMYAEVNGTKYFLAGTPDRGTMSSTTDCGYISEVTITPGTGANAGKYKITVDGVGLAPESGETDLVEGTAWWTITETSAGSGEYKISGEDKRNIVLRNSSFGHYSYNAGSSYGAGYYYPRFGKCLEHHWTSEPPAKPSIKLSGEVYVTATYARGIMATSTLKVSAKQLNANEKVNITSNSNDVYFSTDRTVNFVKANKPLNTLPITADANGAIDQEIYVHYKPSTEGNGTPASVVVSANLETPDPSVTDDQTIYVRNLPAEFVIAAKWDGHWYALPANCTSSQSPTEGLLITVDDMDNPQKAIAAPASAKFGLKSVYTSNSSDNRYETNGEKLVFVENVTEETPVLNQTLYNGSETSIQVYAKYENYHNNTNASRYEWIPTTTNLLDYTLTSAHTFTKSDGTPEVARTISLGNNGVFGTLLNDKSYNGEVRLLPATFYEPAQMQVLKWKANSVIVMYTGAETTATTQVGDNAKSDEQTLANQKLTHGIYELTTVQALTEYAGDELNIYIADKRVELEIPLIINGKVTAAANAHDVVILENSKLTAAETKYSYKDVYVYGGGKLAIPDGAQLGVNNIILRAGGVATNGAGQEATYQYIYPQVELKGTLTSAVQNIRYEYVTDSVHWYHLVLPFDGSLASIHYPYEYYGDQVTLDNDGSWIIKRYDGATRATGNYDAWKDIEKDVPKATVVKAGHGYIYWGAPKKITVNGVYARPTWGIQRITMLSNVSETIAKATDAENDDKIISGLSSYENVENPSDNIYDQGWNLIGNPYMVNLKGLNSESLKPGKLVEVEDAAGNWTGQWKDNEDGFRYVTIPSDHFEWYTAEKVSKNMTLVAGRAFFVQIAGEATDIMFEASNRAQLMPALRAAHNDEPVDIETGIVLSSETMQDEVNFWIRDGLTNDYEYNADYPKTLNTTNFNIYGVHTNGDLSWVATGPEFAKESMPIGYQVPAAGTYMLSVSEDYYSEDLDALYITDHEKSPELTVDLMSNPYEFSVNQAETNNTRFTVALRLKLDDDGTITGLENIGADNDSLMKFIYQDKMYILHHGVIYDATGKRVITINK